jgi:hypothetical protein
VASFEEPCVVWRKSTASNSGGCVEVAVAGGEILIRDSMNRNGAMLRLPPGVWSGFLARARSTEQGLGQA